MTRYIRSKSYERKKIAEEQSTVEGRDLIIQPERECFAQSGQIHSDRFEIYELDGKISINGFYVFGYVAYSQRCSVCRHIIIFDIDHDSHFCPSCNIWLESACRDPECGFCSTRPGKPLPDYCKDDNSYPARSRGGWDRYLLIPI